MKNIIPELLVEDVEKTVEFYKNVLGFEVEMKFPDNGIISWVQMKNGEAKMMFYQRVDFENEYKEVKGKQLGGSFLMYIKTENIEDLYNRVKGKAKVIQDLHNTDYGSKEFAIEDINGYLIACSE